MVGMAQLGIIRWDLWHNNSVTTNSLNPNTYHDRIPFFGKETGLNSVSIAGSSQSIINQEIAYAKDAGISFFAFYWYYRWEGLNIDSDGNYFYARELFKTSVSTDKEYVRAAYILSRTGISDYDWEHSNSVPLTQIGDDMLRADYHKIEIDGVMRPLVFYHSASGSSDDLFSASQRTNLLTAYRRNNPTAPDFYVVNLVETGGAYALANTGSSRGQAMSQYVTSGGSNTTHLYEEIPITDLEAWDRYKNAGCKTVPIVTTGYDRRPMIDNPVPWETIPNPSWTARGTTVQVSNHLQDAIDYVNANPIECEANTILMYAWNEHLEGGYVCPTIVPDGNYTEHVYAINRDYLDVVKNLFNPEGITTTLEISSTITYYSNTPVINPCSPNIPIPFSLLDVLQEDLIDVSYTMSYYPDIDRWLSYHDYLPKGIFNLRSGKLISFNNNKIYLHNSNNRCIYYNQVLNKSVITPVFTTDFIDKNNIYSMLLEQIHWVCDFILNKQIIKNNTFTHLSLHNSYQSTNNIELKVFEKGGGLENQYDNKNIRLIKNNWQFNSFRDFVINHNIVTFEEWSKVEDIIFNNSLSENNINISNLNTLKDFEKKKRFIDDYLIIKLENDNINQNQFLLNDISINSKLVTR